MMTTCFRQRSLFVSLVPSNALLVLSVLLLLSGCRSTDGSRTETVPGDPSTWQTIRIRQHLSFLNSADLRGRSSAGGGTSGAARYLGDRLGEAGYQPVLAGEYRSTQSIPIWTLDGAALSISGRDTIRFTHGEDFLIDAASGASRASGVQIASGTRVGLSGLYGDILVAASSEGLTSLEIGDARLVVLTDSVALGAAPPVRTGVPIVFPLRPFRERLGWPPIPRNGQIRRDGSSRIFPGIRVDVRKQNHISAPVVQVAGVLAGRSLKSRDSLVVLMAPYDGFGMQGVQSWTNGDDLGIAASALLEVAVRSGVVQRNWRLFEKSVMIVFVSGTRGGARGTRAWLDVLPWDRDRISDIVYVSDTPCTDSCSDLNALQSTGWIHSEMPRTVRLGYARADTTLISRRLREADFGVMPRQEMLRGPGLEATAAETLDLARSVYDHLLEVAAVRRNEL